MKQLKYATNYTPQQLVIGNGSGSGGDPVVSPMQGDPGSGSNPGSSGSGGGLFGKKAVKTPPEKKGYLMKKSPNLFTGYQKRYFVLCAPGDLRYYETVCLYVYMYINHISV